MLDNIYNILDFFIKNDIKTEIVFDNDLYRLTIYVGYDNVWVYTSDGNLFCETTKDNYVIEKFNQSFFVVLNIYHQSILYNLPTSIAFDNLTIKIL